MNTPATVVNCFFRNTNWELHTAFYVFEPVCKMLGKPTSRELVAQAINESVNLEKLGKATVELEPRLAEFKVINPSEKDP